MGGNKLKQCSIGLALRKSSGVAGLLGPDKGERRRRLEIGETTKVESFGGRGSWSCIEEKSGGERAEEIKQVSW